MDYFIAYWEKKVMGHIFKKKRSGIDRRSGLERRCNHSLAERFFPDSSIDPRKGSERRSEVERRSGWMRINKWCSIEASNSGNN